MSGRRKGKEEKIFHFYVKGILKIKRIKELGFNDNQATFG